MAAERGVHALRGGGPSVQPGDASRKEHDPQALPNARRALAAFERDYPELHRWIIEGHPTLTEAEHVARFGVPYNGVKRGTRGG